MEPTPYPEVNALIAAVEDGIRAELGEKLVGLAVFGSLVAGGFDDDVSDVDLVAALAADVDAAEVARLERMHAEIARRYPRWADRVEVGYLSVATLGAFEPGLPMARISPGEPLHLTTAETDWLFNLYVLREQGVTVRGPSAATLVRPIAAAELRRALRGLMAEWRVWIEETEKIHLRPYQAFMIVTLCRALYTARTGGLTSKGEAAAWATRALPEWAPLIQDALAWHAAEASEPGDPEATLPETLRFVRFVIDTILAG